MASQRILVIGGAHLDRRGRTDAKAVPGASNPGQWFEEPGGGAFNVARNLARLGHPVTLVSPRGGDAEGERVAFEATSLGISDRPVTFLDRRTPTYTAILDHDGDLVIALADMALYDLFQPRRLTTTQMRGLFEEADLIVTDANLPAATLADLALIAAERRLPLHAVAISPAKVVKLRPILPQLAMLYMNAAEAAAVAGTRTEQPAAWPDLLRAAGLANGVVTQGRRGAVIFGPGESASFVPEPVETVGDVTGAGDSLASGVIDGLVLGENMAACLKRGTALATLTVASPFATLPDLDRGRLDQQLAALKPARHPA